MRHKTFSPSTTNMIATRNSRPAATESEIVTRKPITSRPTRNNVVVWPRPQKAPINDAHLKFLCSLTMVDTAIK